MKKLLLLAILPLLLSCEKKEESTTPTSLQVVVAGLTTNTAVSISITNQKSAKILDIVNQFGNKTYEASPVAKGDQLTITYKSNVAANVNGDGTGTISFLYNGQSRGAVGGDLYSANGKTTTVTIP